MHLVSFRSGKRECVGVGMQQQGGVALCRRSICALKASGGEEDADSWVCRSEQGQGILLLSCMQL